LMAERLWIWTRLDFSHHALLLCCRRSLRTISQYRDVRGAAG
jgi:hypothetical protein